MSKCYNCEKPLNKGNKTREHIPAQNTFVGYPEKYKLNRLTVPCCFKCNQEYSKIDEEIRDAIGIMNENDELQADLTKRAVESIMKQKDWKERVELVEGKVISVTFSYDNFRKLHIKNFKGLFYKKYGYPVPNDCEIQIIAEGDFDDQKLNNIAQYLTKYLEDGGNLEASGHKDIFEYKLKSLTPTEDGLITDTPTLDDTFGVVGLLIYHKKLNTVIIAAKKDYMESFSKEERT